MLVYIHILYLYGVIYKFYISFICIYIAITYVFEFFTYVHIHTYMYLQVCPTLWESLVVSHPLRIICICGCWMSSMNVWVMINLFIVCAFLFDILLVLHSLGSGIIRLPVIIFQFCIALLESLSFVMISQLSRRHIRCPSIYDCWVFIKLGFLSLLLFLISVFLHLELLV